MSVFDLITEKLLNFFIQLKEDDWIQWIAQDNRWNDNCDKLNNCYFIVKNMPTYPQHIKCQCMLKKIDKPIPNITANAKCDIRKFSEYIFNNNYKNGKKELFEQWGYSSKDCVFLQKKYTNQALQKYCNGDYTYKGVNNYAVKIEIVIDIATADNKIIHIKTGWCLLPKGEIKLSTPFSGFKN